MTDTKTTLTWLLKDEVSGPARGIRSELDRTGDAAGKSGGLFGSLGAQISGLVNPMTLALGAGTAVVGFLGAAAMAAADEEKNIQKLNAALEANIPGWDGNTEAIERLISERENLAFSDDELRNSMALLVTATGDVGQAAELQATAMDLARLKGVSLETATTALAKASEGSTRELKALGLEIDENATSTEILAQIQNAAAGQAAAYADTSAAKWEVLQNKFGNVVETVGSALLPVIESLLDFLIETVIPAFEDLAEVVGPVLTAAFKLVGDFIGWWVDNVIKPAMDFIGGLIGLVEDAIGFFEDLFGAQQKAQGAPAPKSGGSPGRAAGGPVEPWSTYIVGEQGPETLVMGSRGGFVIPTAAGFGTPVEIPVVLDGREVARIVDANLYYMGRQAAPVRTRV